MRFDERLSVSDFKGRVLVACPRCSRRANLNRLSLHAERRGDRTVRLAGHRLVCPSCAYTADWFRRMPFERSPMIGPGAMLTGFGLAVWLQRPCRGHVLWAYNGPHLGFLAQYVGAELRARWPSSNEGWQPLGGLGRRLPGWMLLAKHRDVVLHGVEALRERSLSDT